MLDQIIISDFIYIAAAYFIGSIPFGLLIAKLNNIGDIRLEGSGNIGATNVTRVLGKKIGAVVLILDGAKGAAAVLLVEHFTSSEVVIATCAFFVVIGHIFPIWLKFKGGKGVATTIAVFLAINPIFGILVIVTWILAFLITKISSLSAISAMFLSPVLAYGIGTISLTFLYLSILLGLLVILCHRENILRLINGEEKSIK